jgi:hypothetical protein
MLPASAARESAETKRNRIGAICLFRHAGPVPASTGWQAREKKLELSANLHSGCRHKAGMTA